MAAILVPIGLGLLAFVGSGIGLWFAVSLLLMPWREASFALLPALVLLPSLVLGGFVAGRTTRTASLVWKLVMGAVVGILSMAIFFFATNSSGLAWFFLLLLLAGGSVASLGAFVSARVGNAL